MDAGGKVLRRGDGEPGAGKPAWEMTIFAAANDASERRAWDRDAASDTQWTRRTQGRWLKLAATLLGLTDVERRVREQLAERLGLATMDLIEAARSYQRSTLWRGRGRIIARLLERLPTGRALCDALLACGAIGGLWGRPSRWDPGGPLGGVMVSSF
jgi:hypothetical protein